MGAISGINVGAPVVPFDDLDNQASHEAGYGKGGLRTVVDNTARNAIYSARCEVGMMVYVSGTDKYYKLKTGYTPGGLVDADFEELIFEDLWLRTGTVLSPATVGDTVELESGKISVGLLTTVPSDYPRCVGAFMQDHSVFSDDQNIAVLGNAKSDATREGRAVVGYAQAVGTKNAYGVWAQVNAYTTTATGNSVAVAGTTNNVRLFGDNIAFYAHSAGGTGAANNYAFYGEAGTIYHKGLLILDYTSAESSFTGANFDFTNTQNSAASVGFSVTLTNETNANNSMTGQNISVDPKISTLTLRNNTTGLQIQNLSTTIYGNAAINVGGPWTYGIYVNTNDSGVTNQTVQQGIYIYEKTYTTGSSVKGVNISLADGSAGAGADTLNALKLSINNTNAGTVVRGLEITNSGTVATIATGIRMLGSWTYGLQLNGTYSDYVITMATNTPTYAINLGAGTGGGIHIVGSVSSGSVIAWGIRVKNSGEGNTTDATSATGAIYGENDHADGIAGCFEQAGTAGNGQTLLLTTVANNLVLAKKGSDTVFQVSVDGYLGIGNASAVNMGIQMVNNINSSALYGAGIKLAPTLTATANSDIFYGLDIIPTVDAGAYSSVVATGARIVTGLAGNTALLISDVRTQHTTKKAIIATYQYDSTDTPVATMATKMGLTENTLYIGTGPGDGLVDSCTDIDFRLASAVGAKDSSDVSVLTMDSTKVVVNKAFSLNEYTVGLAAVTSVIGSFNSFYTISGSTSALTLTSTPTILAGQYQGQILVLMGLNDSYAITLQDESNLSGSNLQLAGGADVTLGENDTITLIWTAAGRWVELSRSIN